ncbi:hypothetical protein VTL71DRAFT_1323 [Oculimacula yallundae]|uniref:Uncharacterized protein n=1 Tax=Oculimacula yallundae TaxID=86028 RepID=A0ABR4CAI8_9HELO
MENTLYPGEVFKENEGVMAGVEALQGQASRSINDVSQQMVTILITERTQSLKLEDVRKRELTNFKNWLYTQEVQIHSSNVTRGYPGDSASLLRLWVLARRFAIPRLQNQIMEFLHPLLDETYYSWMMALKNIAAQSGSKTLRSLLVDKMALEKDTREIQEIMDKFDPELVLEIAKRMQFNQKAGVTSRRLLQDFLVPEGAVGE